MESREICVPLRLPNAWRGSTTKDSRTEAIHRLTSRIRDSFANKPAALTIMCSKSTVHMRKTTFRGFLTRIHTVLDQNILPRKELISTMPFSKAVPVTHEEARRVNLASELEVEPVQQTERCIRHDWR